MLERIENFAIKAHQSVNHFYGNLPYSFHLEMVVTTAKQYLSLLPVEAHETVLAAAWLHDTLEDCRLTYNDIVSVSNTSIADIVYAVTNEKGKTRKERANEKYYQGIRETPYARFVKLCDRIANVKHSYEEQSPMFLKYQNENPHFIAQLFLTEEIKPYEKLALKELQHLFETTAAE